MTRLTVAEIEAYSAWARKSGQKWPITRLEPLEPRPPRGDIRVAKPAVKRAKARPVKPQTPEKAVLSACLQLLAVHPKVAWAVRMNTGAWKTEDGRYIKFGSKGMSDIIGQLRNGKLLAVECKRPGKMPSADQNAFLFKVNENQGYGLWVDSVDRLKFLLDWTAK